MGPQVSVLIVDDDPLCRRILKALLTPEGYELAFAADGFEALEQAKLLLPDMVLLDVMMPGMDGFEVCRRLRADTQLGDVPVLMVTALEQQEARLRGIEAGADDFITKPYDTMELRARVRTIARLNRFRRLMREKDRYARLVELSPYGILVADSDGTIDMANPAFVELVRAGSVSEVKARKLSSYVVTEDLERCEAFWGRLQSGMSDSASLETEIYRHDGTRVPVALEIGGLGTEGNECVQIIVRDISELKRYQVQLEQRANYDDLTGIPNRNLLQDRLTRAISRSSETGRMTAVAMLDVDRFRVVNDSLSHEAGDNLLRGVARRLAAKLSPEGTLARFGGDDFVIVLPDIEHQDEAAFFAQSMLDCLHDPFLIHGKEVFVSASVGVSLYPRDAEHSALLLKNAEAAMFRAKREGGAGFRFYEREMHSRAVSLLETESALRRAIERDELILFYQPKVDLNTGCIVGAECLIRWRPSNNGFVPPMQFIPLAEETGLIVQIGEWTLRTACGQFKRWRDAGLDVGTLAVNVSARQFETGDLVGLAARILRESGVPPDALEIELTESVLMRDPAGAAQKLQALKALGTMVSLDDFGTGYSSLSYLTQFRIDGLKIDQSFVHGVTESDGAAIARTIIGVAKALGCKVVAEGGETREQTIFLRDNGCDQMQGFFFSRPLPADEFESLLRRSPRLHIDNGKPQDHEEVGDGLANA